MKKQVYLSLLIIILAVAMVGGATMAWFTDEEELTNTFTAGTVEISVQETMTKINNSVGNKVINNIVGDSGGDGLAMQRVVVPSYPNELEWKGQGGSDDPSCEKIGEGPRTEDGWIHWLVTQAGSVTDAQLVLGGSGSGTYQIYGTTGQAIHFYTPYFEIGSLEATLEYSGSLGNNSQFVISDYCPGNGNGNGNGEDNWNPGDCYKKDFLITNEGTKRANLRVLVTGAWYENINGEWVPWDDGDVNLVTITLHDDSPNWVKTGDYWYFEDIVEPGNPWQARLALKVCLDGEGADNDYQGKRFILTSYFESIQASNEASVAAWGGWSPPADKGIIYPK